MGGDIDGYNSFAQRGNLEIIEHVAACLMACSRNSAVCEFCAPGAASWT